MTILDSVQPAVRGTDTGGLDIAVGRNFNCPMVEWSSLGRCGAVEADVVRTACHKKGASRLTTSLLAIDQQHFRLRCLITTATTLADQAAAFAVLDAEEREKAGRFVLAEDRRDYILTHALLRRTLSEAAPGFGPNTWTFERSDLGKPRLSAAQTTTWGLRFSLTHSRGLVACVVGRAGEVGIDIESGSRILDINALTAYVFSVDEQEQFRAVEPSARTEFFFDVWTLKEAYAKACGIGVAAAIERISFDLRRPMAIKASLQDRSSSPWCFALFRPMSGSAMALAITKTTVTPILDVSSGGMTGDMVTLFPVRTSNPVGHLR